MTELVFVYGSLKRGLVHHDQMNGARFVGDVLLKEHRLVLYEESYPALCRAPGSTETVEGELFSLSAVLLRRLDAFEEVPHLYQRVLLTLVDGRKAWGYVIDSERAHRYPNLNGPWRGPDG